MESLFSIPNEKSNSLSSLPPPCLKYHCRHLSCSTPTLQPDPNESIFFFFFRKDYYFKRSPLKPRSNFLTAIHGGRRLKLNLDAESWTEGFRKNGSSVPLVFGEFGLLTWFAFGSFLLKSWGGRKERGGRRRMVSEIIVRKKWVMAFLFKANHQYHDKSGFSHEHFSCRPCVLKKYRCICHHPFRLHRAVMHHHRTNAGLAFLASPVENYPGLFGRSSLFGN